MCRRFAYCAGNAQQASKLSRGKQKNVWQTLLVDVVQISRIIFLIYNKEASLQLILDVRPNIYPWKIQDFRKSFVKPVSVGKWHYSILNIVRFSFSFKLNIECYGIFLEINEKEETDN